MMHPFPALTALVAVMLATPLPAAEFQATLDWADRTPLSLPISGMVKEVHVRAGQTVASGTSLVSLDPRPFEARLREARAGVLALERKRAEAEREVERAKALYARTVLSNVELEKAHIDQQQIEGQYQKARAQLQMAEIERGYTPLKSPFAARVLRVNTRAGEAISSALQAPVLVEVARAEVMDAIATLKAEQAQGLRLGDKAEVVVNERRMAGEVMALESLGEGNYRLVVRLQADGGWLAGLPARLILP